MGIYNYFLTRPYRYKSKYVKRYVLLRKVGMLNKLKHRNKYLLLIFFENFYLWRLNTEKRVRYGQQILADNFLKMFAKSSNYIFFKIGVKTTQDFLRIRDFFFQYGLTLRLISKKMESYLNSNNIKFFGISPLLRGGYTAIVFFTDSNKLVDFLSLKEPLKNDELKLMVTPIFLRFNGNFFSIFEFRDFISLKLVHTKATLINSFLVFNNLVTLFFINWNTRITTNNANIKSIKS